MAGTLITNAVVLGDSATAANNFQLRTNTDGSMKLARGATGALGDILTVDASGNLANAGSPIQRMVLSTAQNTTSGTSIDFTGIPSWVKRITVMLSGVSTSGTSNYQLQIGSGSVTTTGYTSSAAYVPNASAIIAGDSTTGLLLVPSTAASVVVYGPATLTLMGSNTWIMGSALARPGNIMYTSAGVSPALSGALDRLRLTTVNGTDTFDAGSVNLLLEG
jgi:hypothetical protein